MTANEFLDAVDAAEKRLEGVTDLAVWDREIEELERVAPPVPEAQVLESMYLQRGLLAAHHEAGARAMSSERMTDPEGEGLADDLIGDDPIPDDARRFDKNGRRLLGRPETDDDLAAELMDAEGEPADLLRFDRNGNLIPQAVPPVRDTPEPDPE